MCAHCYSPPLHDARNSARTAHMAVDGKPLPHLGLHLSQFLCNSNPKPVAGPLSLRSVQGRWLQGSSCQSVSMGGALSPSSLLKTSSLPVLPSNVVLHPAAPSTDSSLVSTRCDCTIHPASSSLNPIAVISSPSRLQRRLYYWDAACHGSSPRRPTLVRTQSCATPSVAVELACEQSCTSSPSCRRTLSCPQWAAPSAPRGAAAEPAAVTTRACESQAAPVAPSAARMRVAREEVNSKAPSASSTRHGPPCVDVRRADESVFHWAARTRIQRAQAALVD
ncbi:unnamed protein product [Closterium sp. NIES-65]|nr:unnamed protein product [Closterium sp. NIES-65]